MTDSPPPAPTNTGQQVAGMPSVYLTDFSSADEVIGSFHAPPDALKDAHVLLAWYGGGSYDGTAFVLFWRDGKLYEVNGSHCSCYGLEGNWEPEETSVVALSCREWGTYSDGEEMAGKVMATLLEQLRKAGVE